jgi:Ca-activated chloride channel family protein
MRRARMRITDVRKLTNVLLPLCLLCAPGGLRAQEAPKTEPAKGRSRQEAKKQSGKKRDAARKADATLPDDDEVLSVETPLVTVPVRAMDRSGRFIPDLKREDFRLFEDGIEQQISFFDTAEQPLTVALLLDISDSAIFERAEIQAAARAFLEHLRPEDRVMIVAFDKYVRVLTEPTADRDALYRAISGARGVGGTSFYDAVSQVLGGPFARARGRKAAVLLTDGIDTTSRATAGEAMRAAQESDVLVYAIQYDTVTHPFLHERSITGATVPGSTLPVRSGAATARGELLTTAYKRANGFLRLLTDRTNGRYYMAESVKGLSRSFAQIAAELREQYSLGFYPKNRDEERKLRQLKVKVTREKTAVSARHNYVYKPRRVSRRGDRRDAVATLDD